MGINQIMYQIDVTPDLMELDDVKTVWMKIDKQERKLKMHEDLLYDM